MANAQGTLSYTGTTNNDIVDVNKGYSPLFPGGYFIEVETREWDAANSSANCTEGRGHRGLAIEWPADHVRGSPSTAGGRDSFNNHTSLPSEAHGGPGVEYFPGGDGADVLRRRRRRPPIEATAATTSSTAAPGIDTCRRCRHRHAELGRRERP